MEDKEKKEQTISREAEEATVEEALETAESVTEVEAEAEAAKDEEKLSGKEKKKLKKADVEIDRLQNELDEANDKYLRVCAEYDNFRKRTAKEREGIYADAYIDALTQILPILDNLDRAAQFIAEDAESPMAKGLELTRKSFVEALEKMGVVEIEALGKSFDPNLHNAVMHVEDEAFGENEIVEVFMKGYVRGDKVLRYSMVKVAN